MCRVVCGSPAYFAAHGIPKRPADLASLSCVTFDVLSSTTSWDFTGKVGHDRTVSVRLRLAVSTAEVALDAAIEDVGLTRVLISQAAKVDEEGKLHRVFELSEPTPVPVSLVHLSQGLLPLETRVFLDFAAPRLRSRLSHGQ